jgi:hypothetical protein
MVGIDGVRGFMMCRCDLTLALMQLLGFRFYYEIQNESSHLFLRIILHVCNGREEKCEPLINEDGVSLLIVNNNRARHVKKIVNNFIIFSLAHFHLLVVHYRACCNEIHNPYPDQAIHVAVAQHDRS